MNDLTKGTIWKKLLLFAIPLLLSSLIQQLYNTVDLIYVGNFLGKAKASAMGASSLLITCLVGFFSGMSVGSGVVIAQIFGSGDKQKLKRGISTAMILSLAGGLLLFVAGYFFAPQFLKLLNTPPELHADAVSYLRIYLFSFLFISLYNIGSGVLRALGDSKTPLYAQLIGGLMNVVMDGVFILLFQSGIEGVAWATFISQLAAAAYVVFSIMKLDNNYALNLKELDFDQKILVSILGIGVPAGIQALVITLSNVMAQYQINSLGVDAIAAFTAYFKVELVIYLPILAFGQAIMTFSGQNMGTKNYERVRKGTLVCLTMGISIAAVSSVLGMYFGSQLFRMFIKEAEVIKLGVQITSVTFPFYFIYVILQVLGDSLRGLGKANPPMLIIMANICVIRTILLFILVPHYPDVSSVAVTYPITWLLTAVGMAAYYRYYHRKISGTKSAVLAEVASKS